jgi:hypothetical protein
LASSVRQRACDQTGYTTRPEGRATIPSDFSPPPNRSWRSASPRKVHASPSRTRTPAFRPVKRGSATDAGGRWGRAEYRGRTLRSRPFAPERFHVLLNSLFKVLFNFPSRYLFAIGLVPVFSLRWSLPPALGCIPKQPDSWDSRDGGRPGASRGLTPALGKAPIRRTQTPRPTVDRRP